MNQWFTNYGDKFLSFFDHLKYRLLKQLWRTRKFSVNFFLLLIRLFSCFVNVTIITKPPGFVIVITIFEKKKWNYVQIMKCSVD